MSNSSLAGITTRMITDAAMFSQNIALDPQLARGEAMQAMQGVEILVKAYEDLVMIDANGRARSSVLNTRPSGEKDQYMLAKHSLRILQALYGPKES